MTRAVVEPFGDRAVRARLPAGVDAASLLRTLRAWPEVVDAVVTEQHALATFDGEAPREIGARFADAVAAAARHASAAAPALAPTTHAIRVRYDGEDIDALAAATGLTRAAVVALHAGGSYTVATIGFLPGFAYLRGLDARLVVPRRATPRPRVAPLSVAIAGPYTAVYPFASPGGWHLLGTAVGFAPFDPAAGAALALGDRIVFREESPA